MIHLESGQAIVEYLLILVVTVTFVIFVSSRLMTPVTRFMKNYAGAYVECLLETGELPFIAAVSENTECSLDQLEKRDRNLADLDIAGGGSGGSGSGGNSNQNDDSANNSNNSNNRNGSGSRGGSRSGSNSSPIHNASGALNETGSASFGSGGAGGGGSRGDKLAAKANNASKSGDYSSSSVPYQFQQDYGRGISGYIAAPKTKEQKEMEKLESSKAAVKNKGGNESQRLRAKSFVAPVSKKSDKKAGIGGDIDLGFNFGKYLRFFMIGGIIFALIIMLFTMFNNLRKNWGD